MNTNESGITLNSNCLLKRILAGIDAYLGIVESKNDYYFFTSNRYRFRCFI